MFLLPLLAAALATLYIHEASSAILSTEVRRTRPLYNTRFSLDNVEFGPFLVEFNRTEEECLKERLLPFKGSCEAPLSDTTCPEGEWLILDEEAAESGRLIAKCNYSQPCGSDALLLRADRSCHSKRELKDGPCKVQLIFPLPTGYYVCSLGYKSHDVLLRKKDNVSSEITLDTWPSNLRT